jgi:hypothetical protein
MHDSDDGDEDVKEAKVVVLTGSGLQYVKQRIGIPSYQV